MAIITNNTGWTFVSILEYLPTSCAITELTVANTVAIHMIQTLQRITLYRPIQASANHPAIGGVKPNARY